jgi:DNA-binding LacI/PurR family transcriptional regulator
VATRLAAVAKYAGVSEATVSRVLNGRPGVSPVTRDTVLTALDVFGYARPRALRGERARLVGLVVPDLHNPIFPAFAEAVGGCLFQRGLVPVLCTHTADGMSEAMYIRMLLAQQVGGIVFVGSSFSDAGPEQCRQLVARKLPIVLVNPADDNPDVARVCVDDAGAMQRALVHLTGLGHGRIGLILGPDRHVPSARKRDAFERFRAARGERGRAPFVEHTAFTVEGGRVAATRLLAAGVTGLVCGSDALALGAVRAAHRVGRKVPGDVSVIGFDDSAYMAVTNPPLTTLRQPVKAMAAAAVNALLTQMDGGPAPHEVLFDPELVVRSTTGPIQ